MRTWSAGILALVGAAFLIMTAAPGTARVGEADAADANGSESPTTTPAIGLADPGMPAPLVVPAPPVNPLPIRPVPWPVEMPAVQPGSAWPIFGPLQRQTIDVTPQEILPEPGSDGPIVEKRGGQEILPVFSIE